MSWRRALILVCGGILLLYALFLVADRVTRPEVVLEVRPAPPASRSLDPGTPSTPEAAPEPDDRDIAEFTAAFTAAAEQLEGACPYGDLRGICEGELCVLRAKTDSRTLRSLRHLAAHPIRTVQNRVVLALGMPFEDTPCGIAKARYRATSMGSVGARAVDTGICEMHAPPGSDWKDYHQRGLALCGELEATAPD